MASKTIAERLAMLEALEAERAQADAEQRPPELASLSDAEAIWLTICSWRAGAMGEGLYHPGARSVCFHARTLRSSTPHYDAWFAFYNGLGQRVNALIVASCRPFVALAPWEIAEALAEIDGGSAQVVPLFRHPSNPALDTGRRLQLADAELTRAIERATWLLDRQLGYADFGPQARELRTLDEWRAWLASLVEYEKGHPNEQEET